MFEWGWSRLCKFYHLHFEFVQGNGQFTLLHTWCPSHHCYILFLGEHTLWPLFPCSPIQMIKKKCSRSMCQYLLVFVKIFAFFPLHPLLFPKIQLSMCLVQPCYIICLWCKYRHDIFLMVLVSRTFHFIAYNVHWLVSQQCFAFLAPISSKLTQYTLDLQEVRTSITYTYFKIARIMLDLANSKVYDFIRLM